LSQEAGDEIPTLCEGGQLLSILCKVALMHKTKQRHDHPKNVTQS